MMKHKLTLSLPILFLALGLTADAHASTLYVNGAKGSDSNNCKSPQHACKTIGHAISLASSGDTVKVAASTYKENLTIGISLNILGANARTTIVDGNQSGTVFTISLGRCSSLRVDYSKWQGRRWVRRRHRKQGHADNQQLHHNGE